MNQTIPKFVNRSKEAFSLLEVLIAMALFFTAIFAILGLTSQNLQLARSLQRAPLDASGLAAELSLTNRLEEGSESGDFGDLHPQASWERTITLISTNGLFQVDFLVRWPGDRQVLETNSMSILLYRPYSTPRRVAR